MFLNLIILTFSVFLLFQTTLANFMGINTNEALNFDASVPFVDLFKTAEPFVENKKYTSSQVIYDSNGWVKDLNGGQASTYLLRWLPYDALPQGHFIVRYDGVGTIKYEEGIKVIQQNQGRDVIQFLPDSHHEISARLTLIKSDPRNPLRNIRVTLPGGICQNNPFKRVTHQNQCQNTRYLPFEYYHKHIIFNPDYLKFMKPFKTIRFMNMSGITRNPISNWSRRPLVTHATWGGKEGKRGAPVEIMIQLANLLQAHPWFNIPHQANDHYVREFAQLTKKLLRPQLKTYIEYTNEAWNPIFSQTHYVRQQGVRLRLDQNPFWAGVKFYTKRSLEIFKIWKQIYGHQRPLIRILSGWSGNVALAKPLLENFQAHLHVDAFAIAPYFYAEEKDLEQSRTVKDIFNLINNANNRRSIEQTLNDVSAHAQYLKKFPHIKLIAYEGGQGLVHHGTYSKKQHPNPLLIQANRHPHMEKAYIDLIQSFSQISGGHLFMAFSSPRACAHFGCWGLMEHIRQNPETAPKYKAVRRFF